MWLQICTVRQLKCDFKQRKKSIFSNLVSSLVTQYGCIHHQTFITISSRAIYHTFEVVIRNKHLNEKWIIAKDYSCDKSDKLFICTYCWKKYRYGCNNIQIFGVLKTLVTQSMKVNVCGEAILTNLVFT